MRSLSCLSIPAVLVLASAASIACGQFAPNVPDGQPPLPQTVPNLPPPAVVPPSVIVPPPAIVPVRPMTIEEFAASFKPLPGRYEVMLIHPKTCCPVKVCFTLPCGCLCNVKVSKHTIRFVYKCQRDVVIRFLCFGKVWVHG